MNCLTKSKSKKVPKPDAGDLLSKPTENVEEPVMEPVKEKKTKSPKLVISEEAFMKALNASGGQAEITPLYKNFDKTGMEEIPASRIKTAIRKKGLELVKLEKIFAVRKNEKRSYIFKQI